MWAIGFGLIWTGYLFVYWGQYLIRGQYVPMACLAFGGKFCP